MPTCGASQAAGVADGPRLDGSSVRGAAGKCSFASEMPGHKKRVMPRAARVTEIGQRRAWQVLWPDETQALRLSADCGRRSACFSIRRTRAESNAHGERDRKIARLISIRALCAEGDALDLRGGGDGLRVSTHALRTEGGPAPARRDAATSRISTHAIRVEGPSRIVPFNEAARPLFRRLANSRKNGRKARGLSRSSCVMCRLPWRDNAPLWRASPPPSMPRVRRAREIPPRGSYRR